jgi:hypothetical protein
MTLGRLSVELVLRVDLACTTIETLTPARDFLFDVPVTRPPGTILRLHDSKKYLQRSLRFASTALP